MKSKSLTKWVVDLSIGAAAGFSLAVARPLLEYFQDPEPAIRGIFLERAFWPAAIIGTCCGTLVVAILRLFLGASRYNLKKQRNKSASQRAEVVRIGGPFRVFALYFVAFSAVWTLANLPRASALKGECWAGFPWTFASWSWHDLMEFSWWILTADVILGIFLALCLARLCVWSHCRSRSGFHPREK
jgi:hypothetical protein